MKLFRKVGIFGNFHAWLKIILGTLAVTYFGFGAILFFFQERLIYYPDKTDFLDCSKFQGAEGITLGSSRGYFTKRSPEKVIVFYHGNAGRACERSYMDSFFAQKKYSTYFVEYSGYAEQGDPSMERLLANVTDTIRFLDTQNFKEVVVMGESLGVGLAAFHVAQATPSKLILITPYTNLADVASAHYPIYPVEMLLRNNFMPDAWLSHYAGPVILVLAQNDEVMPRSLGEKLFRDIPSDSKRFFVIEDVGHNTIYQKAEFFEVLGGEL